MKRFLKRFPSRLLVLAMVLTLLPSAAMAAEDAPAPETAPAAAPVIAGYTQITSMNDLSDGVYLIAANFNGEYYVLYPGAAGAGSNGNNARKLLLDDSGEAFGLAECGGDTKVLDVSAADNQIAKSGETYSVSAGPYVLPLLLGKAGYQDSGVSSLTVEYTGRGFTFKRDTCLIYYSKNTSIGFNTYRDLSRLDSGSGTGCMLLYKKDGADKSGLEAAIAQADALDRSKYTAETWSALQAALNTARTANAAAATQNDVNAAAAALNAAIAALKLAPPVIPGYTQVTDIPAGGLNTGRYYLIVSRDSAGELYALNMLPSGTQVRPGGLNWTQGSYTAKLDLSGTKAAATSLNGDAAVNTDDLRLTLERSGSAYAVRSPKHSTYLSLENASFFSSSAKPLAFSADGGVFTITGAGHTLDFNKNGDAQSDRFSVHITDFWGPANTRFPIYLFTEDDAAPPTAKTDLQSAAAEAEALNGADYTCATWAALQSALARANALLSAGPAEDNDAQYQNALAELRGAVGGLQAAPALPEPGMAAIYVQDTDGIDAGAIYAIYTNEPADSANRILYHTGTDGLTDKVGGSVGEQEVGGVTKSVLTLNSVFAPERQLWQAVSVEGGVALRCLDSGYYLDLTSASGSNIRTSADPVALTVARTDGVYTIGRGSVYAAYDGKGSFSAGSSAALFRFFKQSQVKLEADFVADWRELLPASGTTLGQPFAAGTAGSQHFRIPSLISLKHQSDPRKNGRIVAAIDARWNHNMDACSLDTMLSCSDDGGASWRYSFPNYFGDSTDAKHPLAAAFIDPVMVEGTDGTIYMMADVFPGGVAINTAPNKPDPASGYIELNGVKRMALYTTPTPDTQDDGNYSYYIGGFSGGYAAVYEAASGADSGFYVDEYYYLYKRAGADREPENDKIYCARLGDPGTWVQQNVFFYNASLHVRCACYLWLTTSTDGGETWSSPAILNPQVRKAGGWDIFYGAGPGAGLALWDGTVILPAYTHSAERASFIYSSDGGATWSRSDDATAGSWSSESCLVQIDDSTVRHFFRDGNDVLSYTDHTWDSAQNKWTAGETVDVADVRSAGNNQMSAIRYSGLINGRPAIILSCATGEGGTTNALRRRHGTVYVLLVNDDAGRTLTRLSSFEVTGPEEDFIYSCVAELEDGSIGILYERSSTDVRYEKIPISDLLPAGAELAKPVTAEVAVPLGGSVTLTGLDGVDDASFRALAGSIEAQLAGSGYVSAVNGGGGIVLTGLKESTSPISVTAGRLTLKLTVRRNEGASANPGSPGTGSSGGGGGGSGTGGGSSGKDTAVTLKPDAAGTGAAVMDSQTALAMVREAVSSGSGNVAVKVDVPAAAARAALFLPGPALARLASQTGASLTVETPIANVTISHSGLSELAGGANTVTVAAAREGGAVRVTVARDGAPVNAVTGGIRAEIPVADAAPGTVAILMNADGSETVVKKAVAVDGSMDLALEGSAAVRIADNARSFADTGGHWAGDSIDFVTSRGLFQGVGGDTFAADAAMNRAMLVTVLHRLEDAPAGGAVSFPDVADGAWYSDAVAWACANGITTGAGSGFDPDGPVTREQVAAFLYRYARAAGVDAPSGGSISAFSDSASVSGWALEAMSWAVGAGIINGRDGELLDPAGSATRGEVAAMLMRFVSSIN